jgi:xylan 1,4-beta-xylosidase
MMLCLFFALLLFAPVATAQGTHVVHVDASRVIGPHTATPLNLVGSGHARLGLRADWQAQLSTVQREIGFHYLRFHGILSDDMGAYSEDAKGNPVYNFQYVDELYDAMLTRHIRPFIELSFMPKKLASGPQTIFWWQGNVTPPKSFPEWNGLIRAFAKHLIERYGANEVAQWYFEIWNEPDLHNVFFTGTQAEYFKLYRETAEDVKAVCPRCRVGGPATASKWGADWLKFVQEQHVPADFLSTHTYATKRLAPGPNGQVETILDNGPDAIVGRVRGSRNLVDAYNSAAKIETPPEAPLELHYTEWNSSYVKSDPVHDQYIQAAFILDKLKETSPLAQSMSYWTFTDIFEEDGPPKRPFYGGFGLMNFEGIRKPSYFAYKFLAALGPDDVAVDDPHSWATRKADGSVQVLFWNYTAITPPNGESDEVFYKLEQPSVRLLPTDIEIRGLYDGQYRMAVYRTGYEENDAYTAYLRMGAPSQLTRKQVAQLQHASSGASVRERTVRISGGRFAGNLPMEENDTVLVTLTPVRTIKP